VWDIHQLWFLRHSPQMPCVLCPDLWTIQWDAVSGEHLGMLSGHHNCTLSITFDSEGMCLVAGCPRNDTSSNIHFDTFTGSVTSVAYSLDLSQIPLSHSDNAASILGCPPTCGYVILEDGWIFSLPLKRRLPPVLCRPHRIAWHGHRIALGTKDGQGIMVDFTDMGSYLDALK